MCNQHDDDNVNFADSTEKGEVKNLATDGLRCISFAYAVFPTDDFQTFIQEGGSKEQAFQAFITQYLVEGKEARYLMTLALKDRLREGIKEDVQYAIEFAEANVRMVSNDMEETATYIAKQAGILPSLPNQDNEDGRKAHVMSGDEFAAAVGALTESRIGTKPRKNKDDQQEEGTFTHPADMNKFKEIVTPLRVLYRASAEQKKLLVSGLKHLGIHERMEDIENEGDSDKKYAKAIES